MSYEIEYTDLDSPATIKKALDDCRQWLGNARYKEVCKLLTDDQGRSSENIIRFGLMMQGRTASNQPGRRKPPHN